MAASGKTHALTDFLQANGAEEFTTEIWYPQRVNNQFGTVQCDFNGSGSEKFKLEIKGRMRNGMNWVVLAVFDETDFDSNNSSLKQIRLMPEIVAELVDVDATVSDGEILAVGQD